MTTVDLSWKLRAQKAEAAFDKMRSLLWHAIHKTHPLSPSGCTPCEEIDEALTKHAKASKE